MTMAFGFSMAEALGTAALNFEGEISSLRSLMGGTQTWSVETLQWFSFPLEKPSAHPSKLGWADGGP